MVRARGGGGGGEGQTGALCADALAYLRELFGLSLLVEHSGWLQAHAGLPSAAARAAERAHRAACARPSPGDVLALLRAFGIPESVLAVVPIACMGGLPWNFGRDEA